MKLYARQIGQGMPILVLHGLFGSSDNWFSIGKAIANEGFSVHLLDLRNHGQSPHDKVHNYPAMVADVKTYLEDQNLKKVVILGHSMGGKTAMLFTLTYPQVVEKLIVVDIAPKSYPKSHDTHLSVLAIMQKLDFSTLKSRKEVLEMLKTKGLHEKIIQLIIKNLHRKANGKLEWKINIEAIRENLDHITDGTQNWNKKNCKTPTLFLQGEDSNYLSPQDNFIIKKIFPSSEFCTIANAGHWIHAEQPKTLTKSLLHFIK